MALADGGVRTGMEHTHDAPDTFTVTATFAPGTDTAIAHHQVGYNGSVQSGQTGDGGVR
jgi:hypothetical protein